MCESQVFVLSAFIKMDLVPHKMLPLLKDHLKHTHTHTCDPLCENPAKVIFLWFTVFYIKSSFIRFDLYIFILTKATSKIAILGKLMVEIQL